MSSSLFGNLGAAAAGFKPYVPFNLRSDNGNCSNSPISSAAAPSSTSNSPKGAAALYPSSPSLPQPLSKNQRRRRNKAARPQPPPPPPPPPIYQPAIFPPDYLPGYLENWMHTFNPIYVNAPFLRRNPVSSNNFNFEGNKEKWLRERGWGWSALLA